MRKIGNMKSISSAETLLILKDFRKNMCQKVVDLRLKLQSSKLKLELEDVLASIQISLPSVTSKTCQAKTSPQLGRAQLNNCRRLVKANRCTSSCKHLPLQTKRGKKLKTVTATMRTHLRLCHASNL